jgi:site-specific DNA recombinase
VAGRGRLRRPRRKGERERAPAAFEAAQRVGLGEVPVRAGRGVDRISRDQEDTANFYKTCAFANVEIFTVSEGLVSEIHVGFSSTINAVFLKKLAQNTHRGLTGTVQDGKSGGGRSYGYRVPCYPDGARMVGKLEICEKEASIIRRIFEEYANGRSPLHIAAALNADKIEAPRHKKENGGSGHWKQNAINGNAARGTGILNNSLYVGQRVWNRLQYRLHPVSRKRVSFIRPESDRIVVPVPELRIVSDELWDAVKRRQDAQRSQRQAHWNGRDRNRLSGSQSLRRRKYLLSGLLECGICGGKMTIAGVGTRKRYYCANHKEKGATVCCGMPGLRQHDAEALVLNGLRTQLMQPLAYEKFRADFARHVQAQARELSADQKFREAELRELEVQQGNLVRAVAQGQALGTLLPALEEVEHKIAEVKEKVEANRPRPIAMPADLPSLYRRHIDVSFRRGPPSGCDRSAAA